MGNVVVGISDLAVSKAPDVLATYALGSCVGICIYDKHSQIGGLSHILLPKSTGSASDNQMKFADTAIPLLMSKLEKAGAKRIYMSAKIVGGAQMFALNNNNNNSNSSVGQIGQRNVEAVKEALRKQNIKIIAEDTGLNYGRSVFMDLSNGIVTVKTAFGAVKQL